MARFVALYGMLYCAFGSMSPFLPELMQYHGLSTIGIGTVVALGTATRLIAGPLIGRMADERRAWRGLLFICAGAAGFSAMLYLPVYGFWPLLLVSLLQAAVLAPLAPLADALAVSAAQKRHFEYGWVRGTGSAAFIAGLIIGGYAAGLGSSAIVLCSAPLLVMAGVAALGVPDIAAGPPALTPLPVVGAIKLLLGEPIFRRLLLVAALILGSHALHDTFAVIRWRGAGIDRGIASLLWSTSVVSEVLMFFLLGPLLLHRLGPSRAAALAAAAGVR
jgi:PPP family 3-phenylpropionic acid transporter